jgi:hypothetical protein
MRLLDAVLGFLLRPRVRRVARWSFVVTLPLAALIISARGVDAMLAVFALEFAAFMLVLALAARLGGERGQVILDLVMHPSVRRLLRSEAAIVITLPLALVRYVRRGGADELPYAKGDHELPLAIALTPAVAAETAAVHLLLPDSLAALRLALVVLPAYGLLWVVSWAAGLRVFPHRIRDGVLRVRLGQLYRAEIPLELVRSATVRRDRVGTRTALKLGSERAAFAVGGRVDVHLELSAPVTVERPFGEPVQVTALSIAANDPQALVRRLADRDESSPPEPGGTTCRQAIAHT